MMAMTVTIGKHRAMPLWKLVSLFGGSAVKWSVDSYSPFADCPRRQLRRLKGVICVKGEIDKQESPHAMFLPTLLILQLD